MAISLYDIEEVTPAPTIAEVKKEKEKQKPEVVSKVRNAKAPPSMGEAFQTFLGDIGVKPSVEAVTNAPASVKEYLTNPIQYQPGGEKDYTNIDWSATAPRLAADAALAYGGVKGVQYGVGQVFPTAGVKQQKDELAFRKQELERQMKGNLTPQEKAHIALQDAKTQQILASLNPQAVTPPAPQVAPQVAPPVPPVTPVAQAPVVPTIQQRNIVAPPVVGSTGELPPEVLSSPGYKAFSALEEKTGGPITTATDLKMIQQSEANRIAKEQEVLAKAKASGVTPATSVPEAQTLITSHEDALTPVEKVQEKVSIAEQTIPGAAKPKATKVKNPAESMKNYLMGSQGFNEEQYNTLVKDILGKELEMPSTGGGFGQKSHPEEWNKYMDWRKQNIEGPKANINFDIKKKLREVEAIEDPKMRLKARNALLASLAVLPAFLNAKTPQEIREAKQSVGEALLPIGMTPTEAGAPTLPPSAYSESKKLGSPFRQMLMGVAPPSR